MRKDMGFLAVGQAGGNIGQLFEAAGYKVMYVNTSVEDLRTLPGARFTYHITDGEGAARDRGRAKSLLAADILDLEDKIAGTFTEEFIFLVFSAGGGTGSGISPTLMKYLAERMPDRKIGGITILPAAGEPLTAQINAYDCFSELDRLDNMGALFVMDNNGRINKFSMNQIFVDLFTATLSIPGYTDIRGNVDTMELKEALSARGLAMISVLPNGQSSTPKLIDSFKKGIFAPVEQDGVIQYITMSMASDINTAMLTQSVGKPLDFFQGYNQDMTICLLSGLTLPYKRLARVKDLIAEEQEKMKKIWDARTQALSENHVDLSFIKKSGPPKAAVKSAEDIFEMYRR